MKHSLNTLFLIVLIQGMSVAQDIEVLQGAKVKVDGYVYDIYDSEMLFKEVPIAHQYYQQALKIKKSSKDWGYASLASLGIGLGLLALPGQRNCPGVICLSTGQAIGAFSVIVIFPLTGTIGIINSSAAHARLRKAAQFYNSNRDVIFLPEEKTKVSFGLSPNGIGLLVNF